MALWSATGAVSPIRGRLLLAVWTSKWVLATDGKTKESEYTYSDYYLANPFENL